ncbi:hypothetical protein [Nocardia brasiliensis]|uniref:hypothetical protein n=1 Tax=Nocardia brasiliensis TaxID=37326 RepID=UPI0024575691|nr:hypothetical protein [Nocardia brasiliensis]
MIGDSTQLLAWIEANLPTLDEDRFGPWQAQPGRPGAISARVDVRIRSRGVHDRHAVIVLSAAPLSGTASSLLPPKPVSLRSDSR